MERRLDWTMMRKRVEIQDALGRTPTVSVLIYSKYRSHFLTFTIFSMQTTRTLRIFLNHTVSSQLWQNVSGEVPTAPNFETGEGIPAWQFKIEGRLLEASEELSLLGFYLTDMTTGG